MKHLFLTIATLMAFADVSAQSIFVKAGGGFATQTGAAGHAGAAKIALGYEYEFNQKLTFAPNIGITGRGWQIADCETPDMLFDDNGNMIGIDGQITTDPTLQAQRPVVDKEGKPIPGQYMYSMMHRSYTANYLMLDLPFNYYIRTGECRYITVTAGPWAAFGFAGKRKTEGDGRRMGGDKIRYTDKTFSLEGARRFDCGLKAGIGYQFPSSLTINLEGEFGLIKTNSLPTIDPSSSVYHPPYENDFGYRAGRNMAIMITLSYKLNKSKWNPED